MKNIFKIALRNLFRYKRRTILTASLIVFGVILMIVFSSVGSSFEKMVIGILTNSTLSDMQIHKTGYLSSIDNLPLDLNINAEDIAKIEDMLKNNDQVKAFSERIRFGAMISNFSQTTNIRLAGVYPEKESQACPDLPKRIKNPNIDPIHFIKPGEIIVPVNLAKGLNLKLGSEVVLIANNKDGSVNGVTLRVGGISENIMGPSGRDGYLHIDDARSLLRINSGEITEIAIKVKQFNKLNDVASQLKTELTKIMGKSDKPFYELSTWEDLSPFSTIARIIDLLIIMVRIILIAIVLISILNVMVMSVYERVNEIGTIASIGTSPRKILSLFLVEGLSLGLMSGIVGSLLGVAILLLLKVVKLNFDFGMMKNISLSPTIRISEVLFTILVVVVISIVSGLQPALKASRMEPVEALRHV